MQIAVAQINPVVGDFSGNIRKIVGFARRARDLGADFALFPELSLCGCPLLDLPRQDGFVQANERGLRTLANVLPGDIACALGYLGHDPRGPNRPPLNAFGVLYGGTPVFEQIGPMPCRSDSLPVFEWRGERIAFALSSPQSEIWFPRINEELLAGAGITLLCVPSPSPFRTRRLTLATETAKRTGIALVCANIVGANDSVIFDGRSFVLSQGKLREAKAFEEDLLLWDSTNPQGPDAGDPCTDNELDLIEDALVLGIRDYMAKCGFTRAHLGLSGGIDSALVAYLAVRAVGAENITTLSMPSRFSSQGSKDDAAQLAANLGCRYETLPIEPVFTAFLETLSGVFEGRPFDLAEENLQARIRGSLLMAFSNKWNSMLLTTGNKSELAMGYCTLYGDTNGALGPIGDLFKTEVFALCRRINEKSVAANGKPVIPPAIIEKPPSAELRPNQKDQDSLPPYELLDEILKLHLFENLDAVAIAAHGYDSILVSKTIKTVARSEFKRRQAPPVLEVSQQAFGMGRRIPVARVIHESMIEG